MRQLVCGNLTIQSHNRTHLYLVTCGMRVQYNEIIKVLRLDFATKLSARLAKMLIDFLLAIQSHENTKTNNVFVPTLSVPPQAH